MSIRLAEATNAVPKKMRARRPRSRVGSSVGCRWVSLRFSDPLRFLQGKRESAKRPPGTRASRPHAAPLVTAGFPAKQQPYTLSSRPLSAKPKESQGAAVSLRLAESTNAVQKNAGETPALPGGRLRWLPIGGGGQRRATNVGARRARFRGAYFLAPSFDFFPIQAL